MNTNDLIIRLETPADYAAVEELTREAFWNVYRPGCLEHYVVHCLRKDPAFVPALSLVLEGEGRLLGHILFARAALAGPGGATLPVMTFGPFSIPPDFRGRGLGGLLLGHALEKAAALGAGALCIEGDAALYGRFGFKAGTAFGLGYHGLPAGEDAPWFLAKELAPGYLAGAGGWVYHTPAGYFVSEAEAEAFDKAFAPKEKLTLPGQLG